MKVDKEEFVKYYKHKIIKEFHGECKNKINRKAIKYTSISSASGSPKIMVL